MDGYKQIVNKPERNKGYRLYVNELMEEQRLSLAETEKINQSLQLKMEELDRLLPRSPRPGTAAGRAGGSPGPPRSSDAGSCRRGPYW